MRFSFYLFLILVLFLAGMAGYFYAFYFSGLPEVVVPSIVGLPLEVARQKLESMDLKIKEVGSIAGMKYPENFVVSQRPEAGRKVKMGRAIAVITSSGPKKVKVPNLLGRQIGQVEPLLFASELKLGTVRKEKHEELEEGVVIAQEPLPEEEISAGSLVDLLVSTTFEVTISQEGEGDNEN